jgi:phosphoglycolate phosphatase-like HAD superfamily hydrolase
MGFWYDLIAIYLKKNNIDFDKDVLKLQQQGLSIDECIEMLKNNYLYDRSIEDIYKQLNKQIEDYYSNDVVLKDGAIELLTYLYSQNKNIYIFSVTRKDYLEKAVAHLGINKYIRNIYSESTILLKKNTCQSFFKICDLEDLNQNETVVIDDMPYVIDALKDTSFITYAVYDKYNDHVCDYLKNHANYYFNSLTDILTYVKTN